MTALIPKLAFLLSIFLFDSIVSSSFLSLFSHSSSFILNIRPSAKSAFDGQKIPSDESSSTLYRRAKAMRKGGEKAQSVEITRPAEEGTTRRKVLAILVEGFSLPVHLNSVSRSSDTALMRRPNGA